MKNTAAFVTLLLLAAQAAANQPARRLKKAEGWYAQNAQRLNVMFEAYGASSPKYDPRKKPVAVFDWDNTVVKNDVGDATLFWMVAHGKIKKPADWSKTSPFLTEDAVNSLNKNCGSLPSPLPTEKNTACADAILSVYYDNKTVDGKDAWKQNYNADTLEASYAWNVQLMSGYKPSEIKAFAKRTGDYAFKRNVGDKQKIGTKEYDAYVDVYFQIKDLVRALHENGFDVWISSASNQPIVEHFASHIDVKPDHVIGVRSVLDKQGRITADFQGCGTHPDGPTLINYRQGKRCWLNKIVYKLKDPKEQMGKPGEQVFAAGDSDTDAFFVKDARALRLAINRNKAELMCNAYANTDGKWIINPMFIKPKSQKTSDYDCSKFGLPNQKDLVY